MLWSRSLITAAFATFTTAQATFENSTYYNPVLPGWNSDPSCVLVDDTFFCATSTFLAAPGLPIYASEDLINWKLISHVWTRPNQFGIPNVARDVDIQSGGFFAPNLRHQDGTFYMTNIYLGSTTGNFLTGLVFKTEDIYDSDAWSDAVVYNATSIDPDLFWDDDGTVYLSQAGITLQEIDLETGNVTTPISIWNGTGGSSPEGPHIYKKDSWYYLLIAEGGTALGHEVVVARARNITGPYESNPANPILSNANTTEYFQTVGHADLFQDGNGQWWGMALSTRSGPEWEVYPMGRESVLFPVTWEEGQWPVASLVRGVMSGHALPSSSRDIPGDGPFAQDGDSIDFEAGSSIPSQFYFWRFPDYDSFSISPEAHPNSLVIQPSRSNLTGSPLSNDSAVTGKSGLSFAGRKQAHTLFTYSVDLSFNPQQASQEAGVSVFLTQFDHIDLSIGLTANASASSYGNASASSYGNSSSSSLELRLHTETSGNPNFTTPSSTQTYPLPATWSSSTIRLEIDTANITHYVFSAFPADNPNAKIVAGTVSAAVVSGGQGQFTGAIIGAYATCNGAGASGQTECPSGGEAAFGRWRYTGAAQEVDFGVFVPAGAF